jgi:hypothetical protein
MCMHKDGATPVAASRVCPAGPVLPLSLAQSRHISRTRADSQLAYQGCNHHQIGILYVANITWQRQVCV